MLPLNIHQASTAAGLAAVAGLFREYSDELGVQLCFQKFEEELATLPGSYAPPAGRLLVARAGEQNIGCVALRKREPGICEMKRLFVRPAFRGSNAGRKLAEQIILEARAIGYRAMQLDTLKKLSAALNLYHSLGFRQIPAYYDNPLPDVIYLQLDLT